ncbi:hypothetical protein B0H10DRAFT_326345 [Mycena sp. CBHHK59/15]|nr:hypothetical protein B0H10DRAFT_326345 [Mycena sp. CBHHK59/15]
MRFHPTSFLLASFALWTIYVIWPSRNRSTSSSHPRVRVYKNDESEFHFADVGLKLAVNGTPPTGWYPFSPPDNYLVAPFNVQSTPAQPIPCVDQWISQGKACPLPNPWAGRLDVVWTWINGSEPVLGWSREQALALTKKQGQRPPFYFTGSRNAHFRDHGELLNSMRSVLHSLPSGLVRKYMLFTADVAADDTDELRLGSVPTWLDPDLPGLEVRHHSDFFRVPTSSLPSPSIDAERKARDWRDSLVPSFNSLAIESQFANLLDVAPALFYLNDDCFILRPLSASDLETPLYGPVFRIQWNLGVKSTPPGSISFRADKEGEWPGLEYTNWLLDQRFGKRERRYLEHIAKVLPTALMQEVAAIWAVELAKGPQVNLPYLTIWYTIEKHREMLLYSYIMLRLDANADGLLSLAERRVLIDSLDSDHVPVALRTGGSAHHVNTNLRTAGLPVPKETEYDWLSSDGYPLITTVNDERGAAAHCVLDIEHCFVPGYALDVFKRVAFERPACGDCLIAHLVRASGPHGLGAFLPPPPPPANAMPTPLPKPTLKKQWQNATFLSGMGREFAVNSIQRYSYVVGEHL